MHGGGYVGDGRGEQGGCVAPNAGGGKEDELDVRNGLAGQDGHCGNAGREGSGESLTMPDAKRNTKRRSEKETEKGKPYIQSKLVEGSVSRF